MIEDVWEVLQSQFEKTQGLNIPLDGSSLEQSSQITHIQYYQNGNGKENFASQGNGNHKPTQFITNGAHSGNGQNGSTSSNGNKTVMDINGRMIFIFILWISTTWYKYYIVWDKAKFIHIHKFSTKVKKQYALMA